MSHGPVAIVTGAGGAIGSAVVRHLLKAGMRVVGADLHVERLEQILAAEIADGNLLPVRTDVTVEAAVDAMVAAAQKFGDLTTLVNTAGATWRGPLTAISMEEWDRTINLCLRSAALCSQRALPHLVRNAPGSIVSIASIHQRVFGPRLPAYTAAKAGLVALTRQLAVDYGRLDVRCNVVSPGFISTGTQTDASVNAELRSELRRATPALRGGLPDDVAAAVAFLAGPQAGYINGAELVVDGGASLVHGLSVIKPGLEWHEPPMPPQHTPPSDPETVPNLARKN